MSNKPNVKTIEEKYKLLDDIEHVLIRPSRYIGSIKPITTSKFLFDGTNIKIHEEFTYIAGFVKLFDEILMNSVDESKREGSKLNTIKINIDEKGLISIWDNGGIPVVIHKEQNQYLPEMIFSNLKAGSNFNDDDDERTGAGTHGEGSTLVNIFSKKFVVETCDGIKYFKQEFSDNMSNKSKPVIKKSNKNHTCITYLPDYVRFGMNEIDESHMKALEKRVYDVAGTNSKLKVYFNDKLISIKSFKDYVSFYTKDFIYEESDKVKIALAPSNGSFQQVSFVNSTETNDGGKHIDYIFDQIVSDVRKEFEKKYKTVIKPQEIKNHMFLLLDTIIFNPSFTSQTKEKLDTDPKNFGFTYKPSDKFIKAIMKSEIIASITDWLDKKKLAELNKQERELNKSLAKVKVEKLIDAQGKDRSKCNIGIFEGLSASTAFRKNRDKDTQGCYSLKGKLTNVYKLQQEKIIAGKDASVKEIIDLMSCIGLKFGVKATLENLRYGQIRIYTDADCLHGDMYVMVKRGMIKISEIDYNDEVLTHTGYYKKVINIIQSKKKKYIEIEIDDNIIKCSEHHKLIVMRDGEYTEIFAKDIKYKDLFIFFNGDTLAPKTIKILELEEEQDFYDITVEDEPTFYTSSIQERDSLILTHNCDGHHITGLLIAFFYKYWKELFTLGVIYKAETPIVVAKRYEKNKVVESINFYTQLEYKEWEENNTSVLKKYDISYKKGLSSLEDEEYREIIRNPRLTQIVMDDEAEKNLKIWFGKTDADMLDRKTKLLQY